MFDAAAGHCNEWVGRVWGENAGEEVKMFAFVFKDMVVKLRSDDVCRMFFSRPCALWGESVVRKYWARSVWGVVGGQDDIAMCGRI